MSRASRAPMSFRTRALSGCKVLVPLSVVVFVACGGGGKNGGSSGSAEGGVTPDAGSSFSDANLTPDVFGGGPGLGSCLQLGASCKANGDCCGSDCANGFCN